MLEHIRVLASLEICWHPLRRSAFRLSTTGLEYARVLKKYKTWNLQDGKASETLS